jgi:hypothetical protein
MARFALEASEKPAHNRKLTAYSATSSVMARIGTPVGVLGNPSTAGDRSLNGIA